MDVVDAKLFQIALKLFFRSKKAGGTDATLKTADISAEDLVLANNCAV